MIYIITMIVLMSVLLGGEFMAIFQAASEGASQAETEAMAENMVDSGAQLKLLIATTVLSLAVALGFNSIIKRDDHENQFGPAS